MHYIKRFNLGDGEYEEIGLNSNDVYIDLVADDCDTIFLKLKIEVERLHKLSLDNDK